MGHIFNENFRDFIQSFNECDVRYILIGGYSVILHGYNRNIGNMDIWVERTAQNYKKIKFAFLNFGMRIFDMTEDVFLKGEETDVFTFGKPPSSIDIMIKVKGMDFDSCYDSTVFFEEDGLKIRTIQVNDLIAAKKASGRAKDVNDLENLIPQQNNIAISD